MSKDRARAHVVTALGAVVALAIGMAGCAGGSPGTTAAPAPSRALAASAVTPAGSSLTTTPGPAAGTASTQPAPAPPPAPAPTTAPASGGPASSASKSPAVAHAPTSSPSPAAVTTTKPTTPTTGPTTTVSALAPRRQPTAAEVNGVISAVHTAIPFVTLTAAAVAAAGNQICTAFDQGQTSAQVDGAVLGLVGAGGLSSIIPPSVAAGAVRTLVTMYCPGYLAKLS